MNTTLSNSNTSVSETRPQAKAALRPLGPGSYSWQEMGALRYQLMMPQAFIQQVAHPIIAAAISKDKKYRVDPWGRARASIELLGPILYSRPQEAIAMGQRLCEFHRAIKGVDENGKAYHGLDPEAYAWVYITGYDASLRLHELFIGEITPEKRAQIFAEFKQAGPLLGIHERNIPQTEEAYWDYFNFMIDQRLEYSEIVKDLLSIDLFRVIPKPPVFWVPEFIWRIVAPPLGWMFIKLAIATLPERFRRKFRLPFSTWDSMLFRSFAWCVKMFYPLLPEFLRYMPHAKKAIKDAQRHPEAYLLS